MTESDDHLFGSVSFSPSKLLTLLHSNKKDNSKKAQHVARVRKEVIADVVSSFRTIRFKQRFFIAQQSFFIFRREKILSSCIFLGCNFTTDSLRTDTSKFRI